MPDVEALLLDLYDTLLRPDWDAVREGRASLAARAGVPPARMLEGWDATLVERLRGAHGGLQGDLLHLLAECGHEPDAGAIEALIACEHETWRRGVAVYDDVVPALGALRSAGFRLGIVSNASGETLTLVQALGLDRLVDDLVVSCDVGLLKPDPAIFELALARLESRPEATLFVDDVVENLDAARSLGMRTALMDRTDCPGPPRSGHPRVTRLDDLWPLLGRQARA